MKTKKIPYKIVGNEFVDFFNKNEHLVIFLNLQIYSKGIESSEIKVYDDFVKSNCELILLIVDCREFEIYFKNNEIKDIVLNNLKSQNIIYKIKTIDNDTRYTMYLNEM